MWTEQHREAYARVGGHYPSDMTDDEWVRLEPLIPPAKPGGRPRRTATREARNAIFYLLRTGCPRRYLSERESRENPPLGVRQVDFWFRICCMTPTRA